MGAAVVQSGSCRTDSTPSLEVPYAMSLALKGKKKKKKKKKKRKNLSFGLLSHPITPVSLGNIDQEKRLIGDTKP